MERTVAVIKYFGAILLLAGMAWPQQMSKLERQDVQDTLRVVAGEVRKHYYDAKLHGVDFDAKVAEAKQKIDKDSSLGMALSRIASALETLDDSHIFSPAAAFLPVRL